MGDVLKPVGVYASYIQAGDFLYISGQIGIADGALVDGGFREQLDQVFHNLVVNLDLADYHVILQSEVFLLYF